MGTIDEWFDADGGDPNWTWSGFLATPQNDGSPAFLYGMYGIGSVAGAFGQAGGPDTIGTTDPPAGIIGRSIDAIGVRGTSNNNIGVQGVNGDTTVVPDVGRPGVYGASELEPGVIGWSLNTDGFQGLSFTGAGVRAVSFFGPGVYSLSGAVTGVTGISGTQGPPVGMNIPTIAGVVGTSDQRPGVIGTSKALMGIYGYSTSNGGVVGETANPMSFAGYFAGNVIALGNLTVTGTKAAAVPFPDGSKRVLYCMESPELWFEDFGTAKLRRGRAVVRLDGDFAKVVRPNDYHVFATPEGDCRGLYVRRQTAKSFEVRELGGGKSSVAFAYRIVARRKDIKGHGRFAKIDTRLPLPAAATRPPRKRAPTTSAVRTFVAGLEQEARDRAPKSAKKRRLRALPKRSGERIALPPRPPRSERE